MIIKCEFQERVADIHNFKKKSVPSAIQNILTQNPNITWVKG